MFSQRAALVWRAEAQAGAFLLIHPGRMLGGVVQHHLVGRVMQKRRTALHRVWIFFSLNVLVRTYYVNQPGWMSASIANVQK